MVFRKLADTEIEAYLRRERPYDCAGAFKSEGLGIALLAAIESDDPTALIGLPLIRLCEMLRAEGVDVLRETERKQGCGTKRGKEWGWRGNSK